MIGRVNGFRKLMCCDKCKIAYLCLTMHALVTGCATSKVINHTFEDVVTHLETSCDSEFIEGAKETVYPYFGQEDPDAFTLGMMWLLGGKTLEVLEYEDSQKLKLRISGEFVWNNTDTITISSWKNAKSNVKVRNRKTLYIFRSRDKEREKKIIQNLEDELNGINQTRASMSQAEIVHKLIEHMEKVGKGGSPREGVSKHERQKPPDATR